MDLKKIFVIGTGGFVVICLGLFYILTNSSSLRYSSGQINLDAVEAKLRTLESVIISHHESMKELDNAVFPNVVKDTEQEQGKDAKEENFNHHANVNDDENEINKKDEFDNLDNNNEQKNEDFLDETAGDRDHKNVVVNSLPKCSSSLGVIKKARADIDMLRAYDEITFDNPNGGSWKQGWEIQIDEDRFNDPNRKLKVIVIPHSHNDPGWIKTFEKYYEEQTKHILDSMFDKLSSNSSVKFIWAEISYFNLWWSDLNLEKKEKVKRIVESNQLEFVTGGWVMPDEANSHYYSIIAQLIEGHQWLQQHLNYKPKNGWSIDPFGMSPTMAYFLRRTGLTNMLIQRTHYSVKKYLAKQQNLEYIWRQDWDYDGSSDILVHMMPFYSYDIPHTCGPDPKICCQFDFKRMRSISTLDCPWRVQPVPIHTKNVRQRSLLLLDQYKKKSMLYKTNILLVPLGDDFRWENPREWEAQTSNYLRIFDYVNSQAELNAELKFGTLDDYFELVRAEISSELFHPNSLTGDFFTYADRDDHYWSGYFTSRPYHKAADRDLIGHLRSAQIAYTLMTSEISRKYGPLTNFPFIKDLLNRLRKSRRHLSLFQHHDGVTGTSKDHVMADYANKLFEGLNECNFVIQQSIHVLNHIGQDRFDPNDIGTDATNFYDPAKSKDLFYSLENYNRIIIDNEIKKRAINVFNPDARIRTQLVQLYVTTYHIKLLDLNGIELDFDILPVFESKTSIAKNIFELSFPTTLEPFATKTFIIEYSSGNGNSLRRPEIILKNSPSAIFNGDNFFTIENLKDDSENIQISNDKMTVDFDENGFMKSVKEQDKVVDLAISMFKYGSRKGPGESSGLYLFLPNGPAEKISVIKPFIKIIKGKFVSFVEVWLSQVRHRITLYDIPGFERESIEIKNIVDIRNEKNFELVMRIDSGIKSGEYFYTDLNGFQMIRRKRFPKKLPIQAEYYPLPSSAFIQDSQTRLTLLSAQPLGGGSLKEGQLDVIMDRRLMQDDNRGAGQGCMDNLETSNTFKLLLESPNCELNIIEEETSPMMSIAAHITYHDMIHPMRSFVAPIELKEEDILSFNDYKLNLMTEPPCDIQLIDTHAMALYEDSMDDKSLIPAPIGSLLIHRVGFDPRYFDVNPLAKCSFDENKLGRLNLKEFFGDLFLNSIQQMTLSFTHEGKVLNHNESILMRPMEIYAFKVHYHQLPNKINNLLDEKIGDAREELDARDNNAVN